MRKTALIFTPMLAASTILAGCWTPPPESSPELPRATPFSPQEPAETKAKKVYYGRIHDAVEARDLPAVKKFHNENYDLNRPNKKGLRPLDIALDLEYIEIAEFLIDQRAAVKYRRYDGLTPLHIAAGKGMLGLIDLMVRNGAHVNAEASKEFTFAAPIVHAMKNEQWAAAAKLRALGARASIFDACRYGDYDGVKELLDKDPALLQRTDSQFTKLTPLHVAVSGSQPEIVALLLKRGADIDKDEADSRTALSYAVKKRDPQLVLILLEARANVNDVDIMGATVLHYEAREANPILLEILAGAAPTVDPVNRKGLTPLYEACRKRSRRAVDILLAHGATLGPTGDAALTPFHGAAEGGKVKLLQYLLDKGAELNAVSAQGVTPFHLAARQGRVEALKFLLDNGAEKNARDKEGRNALFGAAQNGRKDTVEFLAKEGVLVYDETARGLTSLHGAAAGNHTELIDVLIDKGVPIDAKNKSGVTPLLLATSVNALQATVRLLEKGADPDVADTDGKTPIYYAGFYDSMELIQAILDADGNIDGPPGRTWGLLHAACERNNLPILEFALGHRPDVDKQGPGGLTPLHIAAEHGRRALVHHLISHQADPNIEDDMRFYPYHKALLSQNERLIELLERVTKLNK